VPVSPLPSKCLDWREGLQVLGDMLNTNKSIMIDTDKFLFALIEERILAFDNFIIANKRNLNGELCRDVACYVPTKHALNNLFTCTNKSVGIAFFDLLEK
jgi:hypothetical protein